MLAHYCTLRPLPHYTLNQDELAVLLIFRVTATEGYLEARHIFAIIYPGR